MVSFILKITIFVLVIIVGFDLVVGEVENIVIKVMHAKSYILKLQWCLSVCLSVRAVPGKFFLSLPVPCGVLCRRGGGGGGGE